MSGVQTWALPIWSLENIVGQQGDQNACKIPINKHAKSLFEAWFLPSYIHEDDGPKQQKHHVQAKNNRKIVHAEPPLPTSSQGQDTEPCRLSTGAYTDRKSTRLTSSH